MLYRLRYLLFFIGLGILLWGIFKPTPPPYFFHHSDKLFHLLAFVGFSLITRYAFIHQPSIFIWLYLMISAPLLEYLQHVLQSQRQLSMEDAIANLLGVFIAFLLWQWIVNKRLNKPSKKH